MTLRIGFIFAILAIFLGGCATPPQEPIQLNLNKLTSGNARVGVAMTTLPKIDTHLSGAGCLLCLAVASAANSSLTSYARTLSYEDIPKLKNSLAETLRKKGLDAMVVEDEINIDNLSDNSVKGDNIAKKDFSPLKNKYGIDKLLVINITTLGFSRNYSAYIPTGDPQGEFRGVGYIVNLADNTYEWYMPVNVSRSSDGAWDEPPKFPGLTNAYFQALEIGRDGFLKYFKN